MLDSEVWRPVPVLSAPDQALSRHGRHGQAADGSASAPPAPPVLPVLTFGAGLTSLGLGLASFALRLRRG
jgi:hypothetical protein